MKALTAAEVLERLHAARKILRAVLVCGRVRPEAYGEPWRSGRDVLEAIETLERYAVRRLHRADVAAYAGDVKTYATFVLGELLAVAPAVSDERPR